MIQQFSQFALIFSKTHFYDGQILPFQSQLACFAAKGFLRAFCFFRDKREEESEDEAQHQTDSGFAAFLQTSRAYRAKRMQCSGALFLI